MKDPASSVREDPRTHAPNISFEVALQEVSPGGGGMKRLRLIRPHRLRTIRQKLGPRDN